jgi:nucleoside-diphosphate-sugar epimerase
MTTVAVTGASGKLGRHVVRVLHKDGYRGVALDRVPDAAHRRGQHRRRATTSRSRRHPASHASQDHLTALGRPPDHRRGVPAHDHIGADPDVRLAVRLTVPNMLLDARQEATCAITGGDEPVEDSIVLFATLERNDDDRLLL